MSRFLSPVMIAPTVAMYALGLYMFGFNQVAKCVEIGIPTILVVLLFSQYLKHFKIKQHCRTDRSGLVPYPLQWGAPTFDVGHTFGIMASVFTSRVESSAGYYAVSRLSGATPPPPYVITRGIGWQGIGILIAGLFGTAAGSTVSAENIKLIGITRVGSRRVVQVSALWMIFFGLFGEFGAIFASIPLPMLAEVLCLLIGIVAMAGMSILQFTNSNMTRNLFIIGTAVFMGLSVPQYFNEYTVSAGRGPVHTSARWFNDIFKVVFSSQFVVALLVAAI